jgi:integrase
MRRSAMADTFTSFASTVLKHREEDGIRGIKSERNRFALHIEPAAFASKPVDEVTSVDVRDWLREMQQKKAADTRGDRKLSTDTVKRSFALVSSVFTAALERDLVKHSPCAGVRVKKRADERATKEKWVYLTLDEQRALASCEDISTADRLAIRFAIATGLRQGEQFNLELRDLDTGADKPSVFVRFGSKGLPPKSGKTRRVPLLRDGLVAAREWLLMLPWYAPTNPDSLVFPSPRGTRRGVGKPLGRGDAFPRALRAAGITRHARWHDLRHTCASNLVTGVLGRRWTLEEIRPLMGHSSVTITERYSHIGETELVRAAEETAFSHGPSIVKASDTVRDLLGPDTTPDLGAWWAAS